MIFHDSSRRDHTQREIDVRVEGGRVAIQAFSHRLVGALNWAEQASPAEARQLARELLNAADAAARAA